MRLLVIPVLLFLILPFAAAHTAHSAERVVVRTADFDGDATYLFSCTSDLSGQRTWSIREDGAPTEHEATTSSSTLQYTFSKEALYHIGCQMRDAQGQIVRGDFHIDRRSGPNADRPELDVTAQELSFEASCTPPQGVSNFVMKWFLLRAETGEEQELTQYENVQSINHQVTQAGLWDITCGVWDNGGQKWTQFGLPIEFFGEGPAYVPNFDGCVPGDACPWRDGSAACGNGIVESGEQCDDGNTVSGDGCSSTCDTESTGGSCATRLSGLPATCAGGTITQDSSSGSCRTVTCSGLQVLACEKPDGLAAAGSPQYFEMYKQASAAGVEICIAQTCVSGNGYARSESFPICTDSVCGNGVVESGEACDDGNSVSGDGCSSTCEVESSDPVCGNGVVEEGEMCDDGNAVSGDGCSSTCQGEAGETCHTGIAGIPAECSGGAISQDSVGGVCRMVACGGLQVLACEKPDSGVKTHFEMYKQSSAEGVEICLAGTCIAGNGYAKSPDYPICTDGGAGDPVCGNGVVESGEACDDGNAASGDGCSAACTTESGETSASLRVKEWYPQGLNVVFICEESGYAAGEYRWDFGDGHLQATAQDNVYHSYAAAGTYAASCTATGGGVEETGTVDVIVN